MKEELPQGDFHTQEERRLFYVALTRARERLTLTTVVHKRSKPSVFLDDILSAPKLARQNVEQIAPRRRCRAGRRRAPRCAGRAHLSSRTARAASRASIRGSAHGRWRYRPPVFEPLQLSASAIEYLSEVPAKISVRPRLGHPRRARARRPRLATSCIRPSSSSSRRCARASGSPFDEVADDFPARMDLGGLRGPLPGRLLSARRHRAVARFSRAACWQRRPT